MLTDYKRACKTWVYAEHEGQNMPIAQMIDFVINPETGAFEALWVRALGGNKLLFAKYILEWSESALIVKHEDDLVNPGEAAHIQTVLQKEVTILRSPVFDEKTKKNLGIVINFSFDTLSPRLLSIEIKTGIFPWAKRRIIPHNKITKITDHGIYISDNTAKIKVTDEKEETKSLKRKKLEPVKTTESIKTKK